MPISHRRLDYRRFVDILGNGRWMPTANNGIRFPFLVTYYIVTLVTNRLRPIFWREAIPSRQLENPRSEGLTHPCRSQFRHMLLHKLQGCLPPGNGGWPAVWQRRTWYSLPWGLVIWHIPGQTVMLVSGCGKICGGWLGGVS